MNKAVRILIVEPSPQARDILLAEMRRGGLEPAYSSVDSAFALRQALAPGRWNIVVSYFDLPNGDFGDVVRIVNAFDADLPLIAVADTLDAQTTAAMVQGEVHDLVLTSNLSRLVPAIRRELTTARRLIDRRKSDQIFRDIVEVSGDWIWETDTQHRYTFFSKQFDDVAWIGATPQAGQTSWEAAGGDVKNDSHWRAHLADLGARRPFRNFLMTIRTKRGRQDLTLSGVPLFRKDGEFCGYRGTASAQRAATAKAGEQRRTDALLGEALNSTSEGFIVFDANECVVLANDAIKELYSDVAELLAPPTTFRQLMQAGAERNLFPEAKGREAEWLADRLEDLRRADSISVEPIGHERWVMTSSSRLNGGGVVMTVADVTALKQAEAARNRAAYRDALTGLPNQALFADRLTQTLSRVERVGDAAAVACLELTSLTDICELHGVETGDAAIREAARRLSDTLGSGDTAAYAGAGRFLVLRAGGGAEDIVAAMDRIMPAFEDPYPVKGTQVALNVAVGISMAPSDTTNPDEIVHNTITALHRAKATPQRPCQYYRAEMTEAAIARSNMEIDLRHAIENNELFLAFQPQVDPHSFKLTGVEALVRWRHPQRGVIAAGDFVPMAEETGLIAPIGEHVIKLACRQASVWQSAAERKIPLAINLSPTQLADPGLQHTIIALMAEFGLAPGMIMLELPESALLQDISAITHTMRQLAASGARFAITSFGMQHSALSHLCDLPIDTLKIDRSFVARMTDDRAHAALLQAIISMTHSLGMTAIGEGVERADQLIYLQAYGCDALQGNLFSPPLAAGDFIDLLAAGAVPPTIDPDNVVELAGQQFRADSDAA